MEEKKKEKKSYTLYLGYPATVVGGLCSHSAFSIRKQSPELLYD